MESHAVKLFISYSHKDDELRQQLEKHLDPLRRQHIIEAWHDRKIEVGAEWAKKIDENLNRSDIILLLISPDFISSDYCFDNELKEAMRRHEAGEAKVVPIILKPCDWQWLDFAKIQAFPKDGRPVTQWGDQNEALVNVARGIREVAENLLEQRRIDFEEKEAAKNRYLKKVEEVLSDGEISIPERHTLKELREELKLTNEETEEIEARAFEPWKRYEENLQRYKITLIEVLNSEYPLTDKTKEDLKLRQRVLGIKSEDAEKLEKPILAEVEKLYQEKEKAIKREEKYDHVSTNLEENLFKFKEGAIKDEEEKKDRDRFKQENLEYSKSPKPDSLIDDDIYIHITLDSSQMLQGLEKEICLENNEKLLVNIPAGIKDGQKIRLKGKGKFNKSKQVFGDLYLIIEEDLKSSKPAGSSPISPFGKFDAAVGQKLDFRQFNDFDDFIDELLRRMGGGSNKESSLVHEKDSLDTQSEIFLSEEEITRGGKRHIKVEGKTLEVDIPPDSFGKKIRLKGQGHTNPKTQQRGDLYLTLRRKSEQKIHGNINSNSQGVTKEALGIETLGGVTTIIVPENTHLPVDITEVFSTAEDNQDSVEVHIVKGNNKLAKDNVSLGRFKLLGIPPAPKGVPQIAVTFSIDKEGAFSVSAKDKNTEKDIAVVIGDLESIDSNEGKSAESRQVATSKGLTTEALGVETVGGIATILLPRNTKLPAEVTEVFSTAEDGQEDVEVHIIKGNNELAKDNISLGKFKLSGIPPAPRGVPQIQVTFSIDKVGNLSVSAKDLGTDNKISISIDNN